jgi:carbon storage regulator
MLVLTRRIEESLVIDDNIIVTVLSVDGDKVKIGITAPREVTILRMELWQAMQDQQKAAGQEDSGSNSGGDDT